MADEITVEQLRSMAERAGLKLSDEELRNLLAGVNRTRNQVSELRDLVTDTLEPAGTFAASKAKEWR